MPLHARQEGSPPIALDFFDNPDASDRIYRHVVDGPTPEARAAREYTTALWRRTAAYLDYDLRLKAATQFHQAFWEMYVAATILDLRLPLVPRKARRYPSRGPDLQIGAAPTWIEAIAVTPGEGPDAVSKAELGKIRDVPHDGIKLRLLHGIAEKQEKFDRYRAAGMVRAGEPCVIAINAALVPSIRLEPTIPWIVSAVFPFGDLAVRMDTGTREVVESFYVHQGEVVKSRGATVPTTAFLSSTSAGISAVLYGSADVFNHPACPGLDFVLVHNPCATPADRLPRGFISRGREYWREGDHLRLVDHDATQGG